MLRLGAHNSIAGGLHHAVAECVAIGGDTLQVFCKNQRQWRARPYLPEEVRQWREAVAAAKVGPVMVHASYLINMGNPDPAKMELSRAAFLDELLRCDELGIAYLNFHPGSHMEEAKAKRDDRAARDAALDRIAACMVRCIDETPKSKVRLVLENAAGQGTNVGNSWSEIARILDAVGDKARTAVTVDTQHAWACGYDWNAAYDEAWESFDDAIGIDRLVAFHLNDSKQPCNSRLDRHDTVGEGHLGKEFWGTLVNDRRFDGKIGIVETPEGPESWKREIAWLRSLRRAA